MARDAFRTSPNVQNSSHADMAPHCAAQAFILHARVFAVARTRSRSEASAALKPHAVVDTRYRRELAHPVKSAVRVGEVYAERGRSRI